MQPMTDNNPNRWPVCQPNFFARVNNCHVCQGRGWTRARSNPNNPPRPKDVHQIPTEPCPNPIHHQCPSWDVHCDPTPFSMTRSLNRLDRCAVSFIETDCLVIRLPTGADVDWSSHPVWVPWNQRSKAWRANPIPTLALECKRSHVPPGKRVSSKFNKCRDANACNLCLDFERCWSCIGCRGNENKTPIENNPCATAMRATTIGAMLYATTCVHPIHARMLTVGERGMFLLTPPGQLVRDDNKPWDVALCQHAKPQPSPRFMQDMIDALQAFPIVPMPPIPMMTPDEISEADFFDGPQKGFAASFKTPEGLDLATTLAFGRRYGKTSSFKEFVKATKENNPNAILSFPRPYKQPTTQDELEPNWQNLQQGDWRTPQKPQNQFSDPNADIESSEDQKRVSVDLGAADWHSMTNYVVRTEYDCPHCGSDDIRVTETGSEYCERCQRLVTPPSKQNRLSIVSVTTYSPTKTTRTSFLSLLNARKAVIKSEATIEAEKVTKATKLLELQRRRDEARADYAKTRNPASWQEFAASSAEYTQATKAQFPDVLPDITKAVATHIGPLHEKFIHAGNGLNEALSKMKITKPTTTKENPMKDKIERVKKILNGAVDEKNLILLHTFETLATEIVQDVVKDKVLTGKPAKTEPDCTIDSYAKRVTKVEGVLQAAGVPMSDKQILTLADEIAFAMIQYSCNRCSEDVEVVDVVCPKCVSKQPAKKKRFTEDVHGPDFEELQRNHDNENLFERIAELTEEVVTSEARRLEELDRHEGVASELRRTIDKVKDDAAHAMHERNKTVDELSDELNSLKDRCELLTKNLDKRDKRDKENASLKQELQNSRNSEQARREQIKEQQAVMQRLEFRKGELKNELEDRDSTISKLTSQNGALIRERGLALQEVDRLKTSSGVEADFEEAQRLEEEQRIQDVIDAQSAKIAELEVDVDRLTNDPPRDLNEILDSIDKGYKGQLKVANGKIQELGLRLEQAKGEHRLLTAQKEKAEADLIDVRGSLKGTDVVFATLREGYKEEQARIEQEANQAREKILELEEKLADRAIEIDGFQSSIKDLMGRSSNTERLEAANKSLNESYAAQKKKIAELEDKLQDMHDSGLNAVNQRDMAHEKIKELEANLQDVCDKNSIQASEAIRSRDTIESLSADLRKKELRVKRLTDEVASLSKKYDTDETKAFRLELAEVTNDRDEQVASLSATLAIMNKTYEAQSQEIERLSADLRAERATLKALPQEEDQKSEIERLSADLRASEAEVELLGYDLKRVKKKIKKLKAKS